MRHTLLVALVAASACVLPTNVEAHMIQTESLVGVKKNTPAEHQALLRFAKANVWHSNRVIDASNIQIRKGEDSEADYYALHVRIKRYALRLQLKEERWLARYAARQEALREAAEQAAYEESLTADQPPADGDIVHLGQWAQQHGMTVSEHPSFGGVCYTCHMEGSDHYTGHAIDVTGDYDTLDWFASLARGLPGVKYVMWQVPDHYTHVHVSMY